MSARRAASVLLSLCCISFSLAACKSPPPSTEASGGSPSAAASEEAAPAEIPSAAPSEVPAPPPRPHFDVRARDVKAPEGVTLEDVASKLRTKYPALRACYEMAQRQQAATEGTLLVEQDLGKDGKATKTRVKAGTLKQASFEKCVELRVGDLSFDPPKGGKGTLRYTLIFAAR